MKVRDLAQQLVGANLDQEVYVQIQVTGFNCVINFALKNLIKTDHAVLLCVGNERETPGGTA